jgi:flagellar basal body-associated protein FliL
VISVMREYARSLKIVLLIVVVVFILTSGVLFYWGGGPSGGARANTVAVVNGEEIPFERFRRAQSNMIAASVSPPSSRSGSASRSRWSTSSSPRRW